MKDFINRHIFCKLGIHKMIIVVNKNLPYVKRYYPYCWLCSRFVGLPLMGELIKPVRRVRE